MMKKNISNILILFMISSLGASSVLRSALMPGWGELNEYKILLVDGMVDRVVQVFAF